MNYLLSVFVFICVLFFYIHIYHHFKTSNDLEIYTIDNDPTNERLEEVSNIKQPYVFYTSNNDLLDMFNLNFLMKRFGEFDIKIRDITNFDDETQMYLPFQLKNSELLLQNDKKNKYITENNSEFIRETGLEKFLLANDEFLKPPLLSSSPIHIQILLPVSPNTTSPLTLKPLSINTLALASDLNIPPLYRLCVPIYIPPCL